MVIKLSQRKQIGLLLSILLVVITFIIPINRETLLVINFLVVVLTLIYSKISILSLWSVIANYVIINVYFYDISGIGYGILGLTQIDFVSMLRYMLVFNVSLFIWSSATNFVIREKKMLQYSGYNPGKNFSIVCCIIAVASVVIAFPTIPFTFTNRFEALLPGNAWNHFAIIALLFVSPNIKKYKFVLMSYIFVIAWLLTHYERVDVLGLVVALVLVNIVKNAKKKNEIIQIVKMGILFLVLFILLSFIGEVRMQSGFSINNILLKLVTQNTASDVGYIYSIAVDYISEHSLLMGRTYMRYLVEAIPVLDASYLETTNILAKTYAVPGGSFILNEPLMNFGLIGIIIIPNIYIYIVHCIIKKNNAYRYILFLFIFSTAFRYLWYGLGYIETGILWIIPICFCIKKVMKRSY